MSEIPCEQPFEDGTHCQKPRGHELIRPLHKEGAGSLCNACTYKGLADASNHAERVRAELASIKAGLCTHGYRGCKCRDQETEPTEPSTEESA